MRAVVLGAIAIVIAIAVVLWLRRSSDEPVQQPTPTAASGSAQRTDSPPALVGGEQPVRHVRRVDPEQRKQLAAQIAAARARARAAAGGAPSASGGTGAGSDDDYITVEQVSGSVKTALEEAIPLLASCYENRPTTQKTAAVQMVMYSDPTVGTVIDTEAMRDPDGNPLPRELDDCMRSTIEQLALPPLERGGHLPLQYSFKFD